MKRIEKIKERLFNTEYVTRKSWWGEGETILVNEEVKSEPLIVRKSLAVLHVARNMPIEVKDDELIVGVPTMASVGFGKCFPSYALPEEKEEAAQSSYTEKSVFGHHPANYEKLLTLGLKGIRQEIYTSLKQKEDLRETDQEMYDFYRSVLISLDAVGELARRYAVLLMEKAEICDDMARRAELLEMSKICTRVPENPPSSFHEALQSLWITFVLFHSTMEFLPIGRSDQYLYPYYRRDIDNHVITAEQADELVGSWLAKFSERVQLDPQQWEMHLTEQDTQYNGADPERLKGSAASAGYANDESYNFGTSANHWLINMILGGQTRDGKDATNELTYMILKNWSYLEAIVPVMSVRLHKNSPQELFELCADILRKGSGEPVLYNDDEIIPGLCKMGIPLEDARDYANDGCWETLIPGKTNFGFCNTEILQQLEYLLQNGYSLVRNRLECEDIPPIDSYDSFEAFYRSYLALLERFVRLEMKNKIKYSKARYKIAPSPLLSALMDDCITRGREYSNGGAKYKFFCFMITGFASTVDSLTAIRKLVFEDKALTLADFAKILKSNFAGQESFRQMLLNRIPKFGNDEPEVDDLAVRLLDDYAKIVERVRKDCPSDYILGCGIATFEFYAKFGHDVGATADGRLAQEPLGSNFSPAIGMDISGPTAAVKSVTKPDLLPYAIGGPLDLQINPGEICGEQGLIRLVALMKSFLELGGLMLTMTGVDRETMEKAQREPEKYQNLRVRLGGLSAYFIALSKEVQDSLIKRTKHTI